MLFAWRVLVSLSPTAKRVPGSVIILVIGVFLIGAVPSSAEELHLTVGVKLWYPRWDINIGGETLSSHFEGMAAPAVGLRWGRFFAGAHLTSGSFTFPLKRGLELENPEGGPDVTQVSGKADLNQLETGVGYYLTPSFGPYVGYLSQSQKFEFNLGGQVVSGDQDLDTVLIGALFNQPTLWPRTAFYANGAFVGVLSGDVRGGVGEVGFAYAALRAPVSFSTGFKYQDLKYQSDILILNENPRERDTFLGLTLGIHYTLD